MKIEEAFAAGFKAGRESVADRVVLDEALVEYLNSNVRVFSGTEDLSSMSAGMSRLVDDVCDQYI